MVLTLKLHFLTVKKQIGSMFCSLDAVLFFLLLKHGSKTLNPMA
jgi:hypothetical protein